MPIALRLWSLRLHEEGAAWLAVAPLVSDFGEGQLDACRELKSMARRIVTLGSLGVDYRAGFGVGSFFAEICLAKG